MTAPTLTYGAGDAAILVAALTELGVPAAAAARLASAYPSGRGLATATAGQIAHAAGRRGAIPAWARRVPAALRLARLAAMSARDAAAPRVGAPSDVAALIRREIGHETAEVFAAVLLTARQRVIDIVRIARGTVAMVEVHPREVFRPAVQCGAHTIIVAHNHPSGDPTASEADLEITARICAVGATIGIPVLDHLIVTATDHYYSIAEEGGL